MAINLFVGKSQGWLEEQLSLAQDDLAAGGTLTSGGVGEVNFTQEQKLRIEQRIANILHSLSLNFPEKYPPSQFQLPTRTVAVMTR